MSAATSCSPARRTAASSSPICGRSRPAWSGLGDFRIWAFDQFDGQLLQPLRLGRSASAVSVPVPESRDPLRVDLRAADEDPGRRRLASRSRSWP